MRRAEKATQPRQVALRSPPIFIFSGRRSRHERLLRKSTTKKRRKRRKNREDRCESVSSWLIFIVSGCRSMRHERLLGKRVTRWHLVTRIFIVSGRVLRTRK